MSASTFDTLTAARDLRAAGIEPDQAEAIAAPLRVAAGANHDTLATKADVAGVKADIATVKADIAAVETRLVKWGIGLAFATAAVVLAGVRLMLDTGA